MITTPRTQKTTPPLNPLQRYLNGAMLMRKETGKDGFSAPTKPMYVTTSIWTDSSQDTPFGGKLLDAGPFYSTLSNILQVSCTRGQSLKGPAWIYAAAGTVADDALASMDALMGGEAGPSPEAPVDEAPTVDGPPPAEAAVPEAVAAPEAAAPAEGEAEVPADATPVEAEDAPPADAASTEGPASEPPVDAEDAPPADAASVEDEFADVAQGGADVEAPPADDQVTQRLAGLAKRGAAAAPMVVPAPAPAPIKLSAPMRVKFATGAATAAAPRAGAGGAYTLKQPVKVGLAKASSGGKPQLSLQLPKKQQQQQQQQQQEKGGRQQQVVTPKATAPKLAFPRWQLPRLGGAAAGPKLESGRRQAVVPPKGRKGQVGIEMAPEDQDQGVWDIKVINGTTVAKLRG